MKYCTECGENLIATPKRADKLEVVYMFDVGILGSKYNSKTGFRQFGIEMKCPNKKWYNSHSFYTRDGSLHDSLNDSNLEELL